MRFLIFVCTLLASEAAKLQGYASQQPASGGVPLPSLSHSNIQAQTGPIQSVRPQQLNSLSTTGSFTVQTGQSFDQSLSTNSQQLVSGQSVQSHPGQSSFSGVVGQVNTSPLVPSGHGSLVSVEGNGDCSEGQVRHVDGRCVTPEVTRNVYVYAAPEMEPKVPSVPQNIPLPKVEHNIVFIRTQDQAAALEPIIVPPPQRKHVIYVLNKEAEDQGQRVIEVTTLPPKNPEVYFVNYAEGDTPTLPDGIDFEAALNSAVHAEGQVIGGGDNFVRVDGGNSFGNELSVNSGFGGGFSGTANGGINFVSGSDGNGARVLPGSSGNPNFGVSSGNGQTFVSNGGFLGSNTNGIVGSSNNGGFSGSNTNRIIISSNNGGFSGSNTNRIVGSSNNFQVSPTVDTLYATP